MHFASFQNYKRILNKNETWIKNRIKRGRKGRRGNGTSWCICNTFTLQIFGDSNKSHFLQWNCYWNKILLLKVHLDFSVGIHILKMSAGSFADFSTMFWKIRSNIYLSHVIANNMLSTRNFGMKFFQIVNWHNFFKKSATNTKFCDMLSTFCQHFKLIRVTHAFPFFTFANGCLVVCNELFVQQSKKQLRFSTVVNIDSLWF